MIAYDSNILIYFLESHPDFGQQASLVLSKATKQGAVLSILLQQEVLAGFALRDTNAVQVAQQAIKSLDNTTFLPVSTKTIQLATELTTTYSRKVTGYDAIHLATAIEGDAEVFYTNDADILSLGKIKGLCISPLPDV